MVKVTTDTGIKVSDVTPEVMEKVEALGDELTGKPVKSELKEGRCWVKLPNGDIRVYSTELVDTDKAFTDSTEEDIKKHWVDGFKRSQVNQPMHNTVKGLVGLVEKSAKTKAVDSMKAKAIEAGVSEAKIKEIFG